MKLTRIQTKLLKNYQRFHAESLTVGGLLRLYLWHWVIYLLGAAYGTYVVTVGISWGWLLVGTAIGAIASDVGRIRLLLRTWPALHEVINWEKAGELLRVDEKNKT